jgi:hypothetical protein
MNYLETAPYGLIVGIPIKIAYGGRVASQERVSTVRLLDGMALETRFWCKTNQNRNLSSKTSFLKLLQCSGVPFYAHLTYTISTICPCPTKILLE